MTNTDSAETPMLNEIIRICQDTLNTARGAQQRIDPPQPLHWPEFSYLHPLCLKRGQRLEELAEQIREGIATDDNGNDCAYSELQQLSADRREDIARLIIQAARLIYMVWPFYICKCLEVMAEDMEKSFTDLIYSYISDVYLVEDREIYSMTYPAVTCSNLLAHQIGASSFVCSRPNPWMEALMNHPHEPDHGPDPKPE